MHTCTLTCVHTAHVSTKLTLETRLKICSLLAKMIYCLAEFPVVTEMDLGNHQALLSLTKKIPHRMLPMKNSEIRQKPSSERKKCKHSGESQVEVSNLGGFSADLTRKKYQDYLCCQMLRKYKSTTTTAARGGNATTHSSCFASPPMFNLSPPCKVTPETALLDQYILWDFKNMLIKNMCPGS